MANLHIIKHSTSNKPTLYDRTKKNFKVKLNKRALNIILKKYTLYIEYTEHIITQGHISFELAEKI